MVLRTLDAHLAILVAMDEAIEAALRAAEAMYRDRDWEVVRPYVAPDLVIDWSRSIGPLRGVYRGVDEARGMFRGWSEAFSEMSRTTLGTRRFGRRVLVQARIEARGAGSGVEASAGADGAELWTLDDGLVARIELFQTLDEAYRFARRALIEESHLYFVCEARPHGEDPDELLDAALRGGAEIVQLRDKGLGDDEVVAAAAPFARAAREHGALFIVNDRPELVAACGADGVHVGQDDAAVAEARRLAGPGAVVGLSTHSPAEVDAAVEAGGEGRPDQISVGPVFETPTKAGRAATGLELIRHAAGLPRVPWFAIGGIDRSTVAEVAAAGASRAVVVRAIRDADDPERAARELRAALAGVAAAAS
jgi:thiamine-phosphate pyrophosphorylase